MSSAPAPQPEPAAETAKSHVSLSELWKPASGTFLAALFLTLAVVLLLRAAVPYAPPLSEAALAALALFWLITLTAVRAGAARFRNRSKTK